MRSVLRDPGAGSDESSVSLLECPTQRTRGEAPGRAVTTVTRGGPTLDVSSSGLLHI